MDKKLKLSLVKILFGVVAFNAMFFPLFVLWLLKSLRIDPASTIFFGTLNHPFIVYYTIGIGTTLCMIALFAVGVTGMYVTTKKEM